MNKIFLITGVNGIGKTTLVELLKSSLDDTKFEIFDFDERGVPDNADQAWRQSETLYWIKTGKDNDDKSNVICGFMKFAEIQVALQALDVEANVCLLDADEETISKRILGRYTNRESIAELLRTTGKTPEKFAGDNVWVSSKFRQEAKDSGYYIIDTGKLSPQEVVERVIGWILKGPESVTSH